jgi:hypothetical protein
MAENVGALSVSIEADTTEYEAQLGELQAIAERTVSKAISVEFKVDDKLFATVSGGKIKTQQEKLEKTPVTVLVNLELNTGAVTKLSEAITGLIPTVKVNFLDLGAGHHRGDEGLGRPRLRRLPGRASRLEAGRHAGPWFPGWRPSTFWPSTHRAICTANVRQCGMGRRWGSDPPAEARRETRHQL